MLLFGAWGEGKPVDIRRVKLHCNHHESSICGGY
jgi:hypothetical protein